MRLRDRFDRSQRKPSTRNQRIGFAFFWLIVLCCAYFISSDANWNTESHLFPAFSLVDHHTLRIDAYQQRLGDKSLYQGHYYSDKAPGLTFLAIPVYAVLRFLDRKDRALPYEAYPHQQYAIPRATIYIRYAITYVLLVVPSALFAVLLWLFFMRFTSAGWALLGAASYSVGTIAFPFSTRFYSHQVSAILLFSAFLILFTRVRGTSHARSRDSALAGALCGYAIISEFPTAVIALLLLAYLAWIAPDRLRAAGAFGLGLIPSAVLCAFYNRVTFGHPLSVGYSYVRSDMYRAAGGGISGLFRWPSIGALWQITFGLYRGLFLLCPVLLLFFVGALLIWRRRELVPELLLCAAIVGAYFLLDSSHDSLVNGWSGGTSVASRHLLPALPFMMVPIAYGLGTRWFRGALLVLGGMSAVVMFSVVATVGLFSMTDQTPLTNELWPALEHGQIAMSWGNLVGATGFLSLVPFALIAAALVARISWLLHVRHEPVELPEARLVEYGLP